MADANQAAINDGPWNDPPPEDGPWNDPPPEPVPSVPQPAVAFRAPPRASHTKENTFTPEENFLKDTSVGRILDAVGQGARDGFGDQPIGLSPEAEKWFRDNGIFNDLNSTWKSPFKTFNAALIRPAAASLDLSLRAIASLIGSIAEGGGQLVGEYAPGIFDRETAKAEFARDVYGLVDTLNFVSTAAVPFRLGGIAREEAEAAAKRYAEELAKHTESVPSVGAPIIQPNMAVFDLSKIDDVLKAGEAHPDHAALQNLIHTHADSSIDVAGRLRTPGDIKKSLMAKGISEEEANKAIAPFLDTHLVDPLEGLAETDAKTLAARKEVEKDQNALAKEIGKHTTEESRNETVKDDLKEGMVATIEHAGGDFENSPFDFEKFKNVAEGGGSSTDYANWRRIAAVVDVTQSDAPFVMADLPLLKERLTRAGYSSDAADGIISSFVKGEDTPAPIEARPPETPSPIEPVANTSVPVVKDVPAVPTADDIGAPPVPTAAGKALTSPTPYIDRAGNISLDLINGPEDIKDVVRETANWSVIARGEPRPFDTARRGVITYEQTKAMADAMGMTVEDFTKRKIGQAFNAEEIEGAIRLLNQSAKAVRDASKAAAGGDDEAVLAYQTAVLRHQMVQENFAGVSSEAGRALNILRMAQEQAKALRLNDLSNVIGSVSTKEEAIESAKRVSALNDEQKVSKFLWDVRKAKTSDMVIEYWMNAILSGPKTHIVNAMSNTFTALWSIPETGLAAAIGKTRAMFGSTEERVMASEMKARLFGIYQGIPEGLSAAKDAFITEIPSSGMDKLTGEMHRPLGAIPGPVGKVIRIPTRALMAEDEFFKAIGKRQELNALAYRSATVEGFKEGTEAFKNRVADLVMNPTKEMLDQARKNAEYQTFQQPLGKLGKSIQQFANSHPLAKLVIPFVRTPTNLLKWANERSVLGIMSEKTRANLAGKNGAVARDTQIARIAMGTTVAMGVMALAAEGLITGSGPSDPNERALLYQTGWQPNSIRIGDQWVSYSRLDPLATILGVAADLYQVKDHLTKEEWDEAAAGIVTSITDQLLSKTWTKSVGGLFQAAQDPERYGAKYIRDQLGSFVPNAISQYTRANDPYLRRVQRIVDAYKFRLPGMSETLLPQRDIWGQPIKLSGALGPDMISPIYTSRIKNDPATMEVIRLGMVPHQPQDKIDGVPLTPQQYNRYQEISGKLAYMAVTQLVTQPWWQGVPEGIKEDRIRAAFDTSRKMARVYMKLQYKELMAGGVQNKLNELSGGDVTGAGSYYYQMLKLNK